MAVVRVFRANASLVQGEVSGIASGIATQLGPASYSTGGFAIDLKTDEALENDPNDVRVDTTGATGVPNITNEAEYDYLNKKVVAIVRATGVEVAGAVDLSGVTFRITWRSSQA